MGQVQRYYDVQIVYEIAVEAIYTFERDCLSTLFP
jgi:hypothetical protein